VRAGAFVRYFARHYDVSLVHFAGAGHEVAPEIEERFRDHDNRIGLRDRIRIDFSRLGYFVFSPALYRAACGLLDREPFDYIFADYGLSAVYGRRLARRYRTPLIYNSCNVEYHAYRDLARHEPRRAVLLPYVYWAEKGACREAKLVITISEADRQAYERWISADKIRVIPQGFDPESCHPFYASPPREPAVVLFVGNYRADPNREAAIDVVRNILPEVVSQRPDVVFQFIGDAPPALLELAGPNAEFLGFVDDPTRQWQRANLVISPVPVAHGMATKIIMGLGYGKPVLTTPEGIGAIPRRYRQLHVVPRAEFARKILELLDTAPAVDSSDFDMLCHDFGWPRLLERVHDSIEELCASGARPGQGES
jgi:glycosyltransferase involved in cell wall biosynthesis